jgi:hypothetical protein
MRAAVVAGFLRRGVLATVVDQRGAAALSAGGLAGSRVAKALGAIQPGAGLRSSPTPTFLSLIFLPPTPNKTSPNHSQSLSWIALCSLISHEVVPNKVQPGNQTATSGLAVAQSLTGSGPTQRSCEVAVPLHSEVRHLSFVPKSKIRSEIQNQQYGRHPITSPPAARCQRR